MPTYAYRCTSCGHRFDAVQSFSDAALTTCTECGGALRKEYGSIGVSFNGSGFYRTDSRSNTESSRSSGENSSPASSASASENGASKPSSSSEGSSTPAPAAP